METDKNGKQTLKFEDVDGKIKTVDGSNFDATYDKNNTFQKKYTEGSAT